MNIEKLVSQPSQNYEVPDQILVDSHLEIDQKIKALENWKQQCSHLQESSGEGMENGSENQLQAVSKALIEAREIKKSR